MLANLRNFEKHLRSKNTRFSSIEEVRITYISTLEGKQVLSSVDSPILPKLNRRKLERLLQWLEKDDGRVYLCHDCLKLHKWKSALKRKVGDNKEHGLRAYFPLRPCISHYAFRPNHWPYHRLNYYHAQIIMNCHYYGPAHGPPLSVLDLK
ncbi:hypothetical protein PT974_04508 [Cladobotryum mycophilum]|uniref:Uncharacterized protein n=1 Tax=Cladobotryum mycophilum TaxID=491253 RepID=A0ABR0SWH0_9HYPO